MLDDSVLGTRILCCCPCFRLRTSVPQHEISCNLFRSALGFAPPMLRWSSTRPKPRKGWQPERGKYNRYNAKKWIKRQGSCPGVRLWERGGGGVYECMPASWVTAKPTSMTPRYEEQLVSASWVYTWLVFSHRFKMCHCFRSTLGRTTKKLSEMPNAIYAFLPQRRS